MSINNYIPVNRKLFEHQFWCEERVYSRFEAWLDLVQSTRFEDAELLIGNRFITVRRGQLPVSLRFLAERWKWSTKKVNNFLDVLKLAQMITKETPKETGQTILTLCNYDKYNFDFEKWKQQREQQGNTKETGGKQQGNKINKDNNTKNGNNDNNSPPLPPAGGEGDLPENSPETKPVEPPPKKEKSSAKKEKDPDNGFEEVWALYGRKGNRKTSEKKWANLKNHCREAALKHIPLYVQSTPEKQFRKNFETYINQEVWNDEIIFKSNGTNQKNNPRLFVGKQNYGESTI
jgi:hypothetical protein